MWSAIKRRVQAFLSEPKVEEPVLDYRALNEQRIARLRERGVRIGEGCLIYTEEFSTEPYLVELGNRVGVAGGVCFLTHDASAMLMRATRPTVQHFGRIVVGNNTYIGQNSILLPGTTVGADCLIGAGAVVRGQVPDNSLVIGNPGKIIGRASIVLERMQNSPDTFDSLQMAYDDRRLMLEKHFGIVRDSGEPSSEQP